ncbi:ABC transporter permease [Chondrinema litorale]|uniref:ABC transporter permease n=1 Tax=Chondrinema litorale TaxID=2994555 RepID=UPI00254494A1|nr:ABC transporter permease [Chondrinema litorale]UZR93178.1 ABC transporter permease [Chondrinema litorale]
MFKNYLKVAFKNLLSNKIFSLINILGLTVGMAACILIILYVQDELSFDKFNSKADRIYRVYMEYKNQEGEFVGSTVTPYVLGPTLESVYDGQLEEVVRIGRSGTFQMEFDEKEFTVENIAICDPNIFRVFDYKLIHGDPDKVLTEPTQMVINESTAKRLFGNKNPIGKTVTVDHTYEIKISGVMEDIPTNSHAHYSAFVSMKTGDYIYSDRVKTQWGEGSQTTYVLLEDNYDIASFNASTEDFIENHTFGEGASDFVRLMSQNLLDIHLHSHLRGELEPNGSIENVYIFSIVAIFILLIACINYMNLSTARSAERSKEVGLRKVAGAYRSQIILQFLGESVIISVFSLVLALLVAEISMPFFNELAGKTLVLDFVKDLPIIATFIILALVTGIIAGSYPAFFLSAFKPAAVLKGNKGTSNGGSVALRKGLVITQFSLSIILIIGTIVISDQLSFLRNKDLGITTDDILIVSVPDTNFVKQYDAIKREILASPSVTAMTSTNKRMTRNLTSNLGYKIQDAIANPQGGETYSLTTVTSDADFFNLYDVEVIMGRNFSEDIPSDLDHAFIINKSAMEMLGLKDPIGKEVEGITFEYTIMDFVPKKGKIIGVVDDFHFESLDYTISPVMFQLSNQWLNWMSFKLDPNNPQEGIAHIEKIHKKYSPEAPFNFTFLDEDINQLYQSQEKVMNLFVCFAVLAIIIACLGIFGLASFTAEKRTKEIGIRKVLGASTSGLTLMITRDFLLLVMVSSLIAWPVAWYFMDNWLADFNYRIDLSVGVFIIASGTAVIIALFTVSSQAIKAALTNPVKALKYE